MLGGGSEGKRAALPLQAITPRAASSTGSLYPESCLRPLSLWVHHYSPPIPIPLPRIRLSPPLQTSPPHSHLLISHLPRPDINPYSLSLRSPLSLSLHYRPTAPVSPQIPVLSQPPLPGRSRAAAPALRRRARREPPPANGEAARARRASFPPSLPLPAAEGGGRAAAGAEPTCRSRDRRHGESGHGGTGGCHRGPGPVAARPR